MTLRTVTTEPLNAEAPLSALEQAITPVESFYVRNNFTPPVLDAAAFRLRIHGTVHAPLELSIGELQALPGFSRRVTLECAGNGRRLMSPLPPGTPWELGAAGTARFAGVRLRDVLSLVHAREDAVECVFTGADSGEVAGRGRIAFQRALPMQVACSDDPLLAWEMNGEPLTRDHGYPLRLVVPRYYAVASVKWLVDIEVTNRPFRGHFQRDRYVYRTGSERDVPVTTMRVRALITSHQDGARVRHGTIELRGVAWSGDGAIVRVQVGHGDGWIDAELDTTQEAGAMVAWRCAIRLGNGVHRLRVRATDAAGMSQPTSPVSNELGYGNNVVHEIGLTAG